MNELRDRLQAVCAAAFASKTNARVVDLRSLTDGWETEVYAFGLEADAAPRENLILRMYPGNDAREKSAGEFTTLQQLRNAGYPVPQVTLLERDASVLGKPFLIMELIDGEVLGKLLARADDRRQRELLELFCKLFVQLHGIDWRPFVVDVAQVERESTLEHWLLNAHALVHEARLHDFDANLAWLQQQVEQLRPARIALLHRDFHPFNVLLRDDGRAFVIDWGATQIGDFRFDLAWTLLLTSAHASPVLRDLILDGYRRSAEYPVEQIETFEVAACLRRLFDISVSLRDGAEARGMRPEAVALMKQNVAPIAKVYALLLERTGIAIPSIEKMLAELSAAERSA